MLVTSMLNVAVVPHCPASGVKVYTVVPTVAVLIVGLQLPVIPLVDTVGNSGGMEFRHNGPIGKNVGVIWFVTEIINDAVVPHWPAFGVNVYTVVPAIAVLIVAGFQLPVMPLVDSLGSTGGVEFWHKGPITANVGVI